MDLTTQQLWLIRIVCILCVPAFFINLGVFPFIEDESIRALVAFEMLESGNYIVPTINGDPYYYKPPLFNWILALSYTLFGNVNEWTSRIPSVLMLFGFTYYIYWICRRHTSHQVFAAATALTFLTCGRILLYDSYLGLIDITFSWAVFVQLTLFYKLRDNPKKLVNIYLFTAIAYMMKGFPAFVFLGGGMIAYVGFYREIKSLLTKWHLIGIALLVTLIGGYYGLYKIYHNPTNTFAPLLEQSTMRTFVAKEITDLIKHIFTFPFENVYHFLPWSFLTICGIKWLRKENKEYNRFSDFMGFLFIVNIPVYWVSPGTYPRYLIMLIPLYFGFFLAFYFKYRDSMPVKITDIILITLICLVSITGFLCPWTPFGGSLVRHAVGFGVGVVGVSLLYAIKRKWIPTWLAMVTILLCMRIQYNLSTLPNRNIRNGGARSRMQAKQVATKYQPLYLYKNAKMDKSSSFYLATTQGRPLSRKSELLQDTYYIVDTLKTDFPSGAYQIVDSLQIVERQRMTYIIKGE